MALSGMIFDIDGTLIDNNGAHVEAWHAAFAGHGYRIEPDRIAIEVGKGGDQLVPAILGPTADTRDGDALRKAQRSAYLGIARERRFPVFPGVTELFATLRARGIRTALATSSDPAHIDATIASSGLDLRSLAEAFISHEDAAASKPAPDLVLAAAAMLGLSPAECAILGDTVYDAESATHAGVVSLGVLSGGTDEAAFKAAGARAVWRDTAHVLDDLDNVLSKASPGKDPLTRALQERLMREALAVAAEGMRAGEVPIGAVLARGDGQIVARGHNQMQGDRIVTAHAEMVAFAAAAGAIPSGARDMILVSTLEPCVMCTGAAMETAVDAIVFGLCAPADNGSTRVRPPQSPDNQMPRIVGHVFADQSRRLLTEWLHQNGNPEQRPFVELLLRQT